MKFWRDGLRAALAAVAVALLAGCGGGDQVDPFSATRVLAFGDETSVIEADGRKYGINFLTPNTTTLDCAQHAIWVQSVASHYGLAFPQCGGDAAAPSRILAAAGTGVAQLRGQVDAFLQGGGAFGSSDLVTMHTGANDIRALQQQVESGAITVDQAVAQVEQLGNELAAEVNRVATLGAKVLIATVPDQSFTPEGRADAARAANLRRLSQRFNARLRIGLINDGRMIGLVLFDEAVLSLVNSGAFNVTDPACTGAGLTDVLQCTTLTLTEAAAASLGTWLWADQRHHAPLGQSTLGSIAVSRAANNPF